MTDSVIPTLAHSNGEMINREALYRELRSNHCDRTGTLTKTQLVLAEELGVTYQFLSMVFAEWVKMGRMNKHRIQFQLKDPDKYEWSGPEYEAARKAARQAPTRRAKKLRTTS